MSGDGGCLLVLVSLRPRGAGIMLGAMSGDGKNSGARRPQAISRPRVPPGPLADLKALLYELYLTAGTPTLDRIASWIAADEHEDLTGAPGRDTIARIIGGPGIPASQSDVTAVATVLARAARWDPGDAAGRIRDLWVAARMAPVTGVPLAEVTDPFALDVHRPVTLDGSVRLPQLPAYVRRPHDNQLTELVVGAAEGRSVMAVLVGGSSAGKTRACWEALEPLRREGGWRLWHPYDPTRPEAILRDLPGVGQQTVVWLNETQEYLAGTGDVRERIAAMLRSLLADPARAPTLVLGTLWPDHYAALTQRPGSLVQQLLEGTVIEVPTSFTHADLTALRQAAAADKRLAWAAEHAEDGQITQQLACGPALLERYRTAPAAAKALTSVAMDARRLGVRGGLLRAFLEEAAPGYLTSAERALLGENWVAQALAYAAAPVKGACGPLTCIRSGVARPGRVRHGSHDNRTIGELAHRLADYLDQYGRSSRAGLIPPPEFWVAAAAHTGPGDQVALASAARACGLYRAAAQLVKNATASGNPTVAYALIRDLHVLHPDDHRPARWAAAHAALDDPGALDNLMDSLQEAGAGDQATVLADRAAARAPLDDPLAVGILLHNLRKIRAGRQTATLLARNPAARTFLGNPKGVAILLGELRQAAEDRQTGEQLACHPAAQAIFDEYPSFGIQLQSWQEAGAGAEEQVVALLSRQPAAHVSLDNPDGIGYLVHSLREADAEEQATVLANRAAAHVPLDNPGGVGGLIHSLREAGAEEQATVLANRAAAHVPLNNPGGVASLLDSLRKAGADQAVAAILRRFPAAHVALRRPRSVASLLDSLRRAGAEEQIAALADRAATHAPLDDPHVGILEQSLRKAGAEEQAAALAHRAAAHAPPGSTEALIAHLHGLRGMDADLIAAHAYLDDPRCVEILFHGLREAGADRAVAALLERDPAAHVTLDNLETVASLLRTLHKAGAEGQAAALADRAAAHAPLGNRHITTSTLVNLRTRRPDGQFVAPDLDAAHLYNLKAVARLLDRLREVGADEQAAVLVCRLPAAGLFRLFLMQHDNGGQFRFGREADGTPAARWGWDDLD